VRLERYLWGVLTWDEAWEGKIDEKRELSDESGVVESIETGEEDVGFLGTIVLEKSANAVCKDAGGVISAFSKEPDLCGGEREGSVNNEPVDISW
jgi:hypothetical protein